MKIRDIFLGIGAVVGICTTAPMVASYTGVWLWLSVPVVAAYVVVLWRWGLGWVADDDVAGAPVAQKLFGVLILLGWSFVGVALLVYLAMLTLQYWPLVVVSLLVVVAFVGAMWLGELFGKGRTPGAPAPPPAPNPGPDDIVR